MPGSFTPGHPPFYGDFISSPTEKYGAAKRTHSTYDKKAPRALPLALLSLCFVKLSLANRTEQFHFLLNGSLDSFKAGS